MAKSSGVTIINANYLLHVGYIRTGAGSTSSSYSSSAEFLEGMSTYWGSAVDVLKGGEHAKFMVKDNIYSTNKIGNIVEVSREGGGYGFTRNSLVLDYNVTPEAYYQEAMKVIKETNMKLVAAIKEQL